MDCHNYNTLFHNDNNIDSEFVTPTFRNVVPT